MDYRDDADTASRSGKVSVASVSNRSKSSNPQTTTSIYSYSPPRKVNNPIQKYIVNPSKDSAANVNSKGIAEVGNDLCGVDPDVKLRECAAFGSLHDLKEALKDGANVNSVDDLGWSALHRAAFYGHVPVVRELLKRQVDVLLKTKVSH
jgi:ankyrin repeat protein